MSEPLDVIEGINSLDDVLHTTAHALTAICGDIDTLRASGDEQAHALAGVMRGAARTLCEAAAKIIVTPDDQVQRKVWVEAANWLHDLGEEATMRFSDLERKV